VVQRQDAGERRIAVPHGQDVGALAKPVQHRVEQAAREDRGAEIVNAGGVAGVMRRAVRFVRPHGDVQLALKALADLGALLARDREQLRFVVFRQIAHEARMLAGHRIPSAGHGAAAQLDLFAAQPFGQFAHRMGKRGFATRIDSEDATIDRKAAGDQRATE